MYASNDTVQEVKVKRSVGRSVKLDISSDLVPASLLVCPSNDDLKRLFLQADTEHPADLNKYDTGQRWSLNES